MQAIVEHNFSCCRVMAYDERACIIQQHFVGYATEVPEGCLHAVEPS